MTRRLTVALLLTWMSVNAQPIPPDIAALRDPEWSTRYAALQKILASPTSMKSGEVEEALLDCLEREDKILNQLTPGSALGDNEAYADSYLSSLSDAVMHIAQTSNSQRAYDALAIGVQP